MITAITRWLIRTEGVLALALAGVGQVMGTSKGRSIVTGIKENAMRAKHVVNFIGGFAVAVIVVSCAEAPSSRVASNPEAVAALSLDQARDILGPGSVEISSDNLRDGEHICPYDRLNPAVTFLDNGHGKVEWNPDEPACDPNASITQDMSDKDYAVLTAQALRRVKMSTFTQRSAWRDQRQQQFSKVADVYRSADPRPVISEDVRRFHVIADTAFQDKRFSDAARAYESGLKLAPWWPEGQFNAALVFGAIHFYDDAIEHMKEYLALVPDATDARDARDKIYAWQSEQQASTTTTATTPLISKRPKAFGG